MERCALDSFSVAEQPVFARAREEEVFGDVELVSFADLDGFALDEPPAFQGVHGVAGERCGVAGLHLQTQLTGAQTGSGGFVIDDRQRHHFVRDQIVGDGGSGR